MRKLLLSMFMLLFAFYINAQGNKPLTKKYTQEQVSRAVTTDLSWVSYPNYADREGWNTLFGEYSQKLIKDAEKLLDYQWEVTTFTSYLEFRRSGAREPMERSFNKNIKNLNSLVFAELAEGKGRFVDQIINGSMMLCEMTSWSLSAHLIVQPSRSPLPNHQYHVIDLVSGDLSSFLSWVHYFFKDTFNKIEPEISDRLVYELKRRTLEPYMDGNKYWWMALGREGAFVNNWNPWCNSNVLTTALLIEDNPDKLAQIVYKTMRSVDEFFAYVKEDGACEEGPSYWQHAAGKAYDFLNILDLATNGQLTIFDNKQVKDMGEYIFKSFIGDGWMVNFADAEAKANLNYYHIYRYGKAVDSKQMMEFAAYLNKKQPFDYKVSRDFYDTLASFSIREELSKQRPVLKHDKYTWYPQTEFAYFTTNNVFFAAKGGYNDESHNHNDVGSFLLYYDDKPIFIDAGVGTYNAKTFSSRRYEIWNMQSGNHSLPIINGVEQKNGRKYKAQDVQFNGKQGRFSLDISKAYPEEAAVKSWNRSYSFKNKSLTIVDSFDLQEAKVANVVNFITANKFSVVKEGILKVVSEGKDIFLHYDTNQFYVNITPIELTDVRLTKFWGTKIYKISFKAKETVLKGKYTFNIKY